VSPILATGDALGTASAFEADVVNPVLFLVEFVEFVEQSVHGTPAVVLVAVLKVRCAGEIPVRNAS
jgi:hypothetical protein